MFGTGGRGDDIGGPFHNLDFRHAAKGGSPQNIRVERCSTEKKRKRGRYGTDKWRRPKSGSGKISRTPRGEAKTDCAHRQRCSNLKRTQLTHLCEMNTGLRPGRTVSAKLRTSLTWSEIFTFAPFASACSDNKHRGKGGGGGDAGLTVSERGDALGRGETRPRLGKKRVI